MASPMMKNEIYDHDSKHPPLPGHKEHHCTDIPWLVLFVLALAGIGYTQLYAYQNGNLRRLTHGFDYNNNLCGVDAMEAKPYVYWCKDPTGQGLELKYPLCVADCPLNTTGITYCFDANTQQTTGIPTYPTRHVGPFCAPKQATLLRHLIETFLGQGGASRFFGILQDIRSARMLLAGAAVLAIIIGYAYLFLLDHYAGPVVKVSMFAMIMGPMAGGAYFLYYGLVGAGEDSAVLYNDPQSNLIFGVSGFGIGIASLFVACCFYSGTDTAIGCIEASCECLFDEPTLLLEPFISLAAKALTLSAMLAGMSAMASCGNVTSSGQVGIMRRFEWTDEELAYLAFLFFMLLWLLEFGNAMTQYVLAYATQLWYFTPYVDDRKKDVPAFGICKGYANVIFFHLGTLSIGSLLIASCRVLRIIFASLAQSAQAQGNCVGACIAKVCVCVITFFKNFLEFMNKNAYMDVAITSEGFCTAGSRAMGLMVEEGSVVAILNGAQTIFQLVGMGLISGIPSVLTYVVCKRLDTFSNQESLNFVQFPKWVALAAGIVSGIVGISFMLVFDTVGDTILYCFATDQRRQSVVSQLVPLKSSNDGKASSDGDSEDDEGFFGWLFGSAEEAKGKVEAMANDVFGEPPVVYTPPRLQQLILDHQHLVE